LGSQALNACNIKILFVGIGMNLIAKTGVWFNWFRVWKCLPVLSWVKAAQFYKNSDFVSAKRCYQDGIKKHPKHKAAALARLDLAYCHYRDGELSEALAELYQIVDSKAVKNCSEDVYYLLSRINYILGNESAQLDYLRKGAKLFPDSIKIWTCYLHSLARHSRHTHNSITAEAGFVKEYVEDLRRPLALTDSKLDMLDTAIAHYLLVFDDQELGESMISQVLAGNTAPFEAVLLRGSRLLESGRVLLARQQLCRAMGMDLRDPEPARLLAESYMIEGQFYNVHWAEQLANSSCRISVWKNQKCLETLKSAYNEVEELDTAELIDSRILKLAAA
jgi:tetratricopeptide (TPR) repeat protein